MATRIKMKITAPANECFVMAKLDAEQLNSFNNNELKTLIYFGGNEKDINKAATALAIDAGEMKEIVEKLKKLDYVSFSEETVKPAKKRSSQYESEDIADALDTDSSFTMLSEYAATNLEKQLNRNDLNTLFDLYDFYGMSTEFICGIIDYAATSNKRSMSFVFNSAVTINAQGINTYDQLESYLSAKRVSDSKAGRFRKLCGFGTRELSEKEKRFTDRWFLEMRLSFELVKLAYEKTVDATGEISLPYMSKILEQWYAKGIKTPDDVASMDTKPKAAVGGNNDDDIEELFAAAAKKGKLKKTNNTESE